ncbi:unnamed protein product, partial [marine sediment metagenome]
HAPTLAEVPVGLHQIRLLLEELGELAKAIEQKSLLRIADGVIDLLGVTFGV